MVRKLRPVVLTGVLLMALTGCGSEAGDAPAAGSSSGDYPSKDVTLIVQAKPGGTSDLVARAIAKNVEESLGRPVIVENRPGASGSIAMRYVASQPADGYTIGYLPVEVSMLQYLGYDVKPDQFAMLAGAIEVPAVLTVPSASPIKSLEDFLNEAKDRPGELTVGNAGPGSIWHAATGAIEQEADVDLRPVPFDGGAPAVAALLGNKIDATSVGISEVLSGVQSGELRALAVLADERNPQLPDVPTAKEQGLDVTVSAWGGFGAPRGTPEEVVTALSGAIRTATEDAAFTDAMEKQGIEVIYRDPEEFATFATEQSAVFADIVPALGVAK